MSLVRFRFWALVLDIMGRQVRTDHKCRCGSMVEHQPSKLNTWVRFPSPALRYRFDIKCASGSVGGARPCQGRGRGFESRLALDNRNRSIREDAPIFVIKLLNRDGTTYHVSMASVMLPWSRLALELKDWKY